jgi:DNA/RNA endonuclease YhcR with UshA esterase domain
MKNIDLFKISLIISLFGILILLILSNTLTPKLFNIKDINSNDAYKKILLEGVVVSIKNYPDFTIIRLKDNTGSINVIVEDNIDLEKNTTVKIIGKINEYNNELEIKADKIYIIN